MEPQWHRGAFEETWPRLECDRAVSAARYGRSSNPQCVLGILLNPPRDIGAERGAAAASAGAKCYGSPALVLNLEQHCGGIDEAGIGKGRLDQGDDLGLT